MEAKVTATVIPIHMTENRLSQNPLRLNRLLQLCSANLPVGGFSFSQGLEYAVEMGWVNNAKSTQEWISFNLNQSIAYTDLALLNRLQKSLVEDDFGSFHKWNQHALACRESNELYLADVAMGKALMRLLKDIQGIDSQHYVELIKEREISFVSAFALSAYLFGLDLNAAQSGFCWAYIDNQVAAATKLVPLGQTQGQNLLFELSEQVEQAIELANQLDDENIGASLPRLAMASAWHETQYTRLFRS
ncbi:urease accessory protein UreF [Paraglaciecola arctica]|uniref:Urease accessory protein UreF n=1 Tax=Paraglaciecola arctica BSs20135 TaxID=493475 RepID=K6Z3I7_9ALTE|nr:urease accessory protein UreF [Paraglaciecola arctica]GAC18000.1 urease accessory protein [Paraglaciecola arctica BSs20135]